MRHLTPEEIKDIQSQCKAAGLSVAGLNQLCGLRSNRLTEACRLRVKLSSQEIEIIFSNLKTAKKIPADDGVRMICTVCKDRLTGPGQKKCTKCLGHELPKMGEAVLEIGGQKVPSVQELEAAAEVTRYAEKLAGLVTPVIDMVKDLESRVVKSLDDLGDWRAKVDNDLTCLRAWSKSAKPSNAELESRIEHCMQELSRQGQRIISVQTDLDDRITALAQAQATIDTHTNVNREDIDQLGDQVRLLGMGVHLPEPTAKETLDLLKSFANFERVCRQMRNKCPHLYAATVRRAEEAVF